MPDGEQPGCSLDFHPKRLGSKFDLQIGQTMPVDYGGALLDEWVLHGSTAL